MVPVGSTEKVYQEYIGRDIRVGLELATTEGISDFEFTHFYWAKACFSENHQKWLKPKLTAMSKKPINLFHF